jgi:ATP:corrinoid adenosyltransferase
MGEEIKSNAERKMYSVLQELDLKNAYVLHSLGLPKHQSKIYGEIDFVVVCERGVACLEIKGGRVECREGKWFFTDRYGVERQKPEGPFAQVVGNMFSLKDVLKSRFKNDAHIKDALVASGVVFPDIEFKSASQEIIPEIIYDKNTDNITDYINGVFDYWQERGHRSPAKLPPSSIKEIVNYFRGEFSFIPTLSDRLDEVEQHLVHLTAQQVQVLDALEANRHLLIEGNAGTGKTLLALDFALKKARQGKRVLYLAYNKNLANNLKRQLSDSQPETLKIINLHALFGESVPIDTEQMKQDSHKYFTEILPDIFYHYILDASAEELERMQYELLVIDEGQDILKPEYLYSLDLLLKGGLENGEWAVFYDEKQNIYNPDYQDGMEILQSYQSTKFRLFVNCRNTVQIGTYSSRASGVEMPEFIRENGEEVQTLSYVGEEDFKNKVREILKSLRAERVDLRDVVFLSPKKYAGSLLSQAGIQVNELAEDYDPTVNLPKYATIQGFKGLDAKIVILVDIKHIREESYSKFMYIAATRARTLLYIVGSEEFWSRHKI